METDFCSDSMYSVHFLSVVRQKSVDILSSPAGSTMEWNLVKDGFFSGPLLLLRGSLSLLHFFQMLALSLVGLLFLFRV